jgi:hypothetical protein
MPVAMVTVREAGAAGAGLAGVVDEVVADEAVM